MDNIRDNAFSEGQKAGTAARQGDWSRVKSTADYFRRLLALCSPEERIIQQKSYDAGYKDGYGLPSGERYFR